MNKTLKKLSSVMAGLVITAATFVPFVNASAVRGPMDRKTFTMENPADYITFNSITNNKAGVYNEDGDERNFVLAAPTKDNQQVRDRVMVDDLETAWVYAYVHNNAATNLNLTARDVTAKFDISKLATYSDGRYVLPVEGAISSIDANPNKVTDDAYFTADKPFSLSYVENSANWATYNNGNPFVKPLENPTTGSGANLGNIKGCTEYSGWVTFQVKINFDDFSLDKSVRFNGQGASDWKKQIDAKTGDIVDFKLVYDHNGTGTQNNVTIVDKLPEGLEYVVGSTRIKNFLHQDYPFVKDLNAELDTAERNITTTGLNIGNYVGNANAAVTFSARVTDAEKLAACGKNSLTNLATVYTEYDGTRSSTASVVVEKVCEDEPEVPVTPQPELPKTGAEFIGILGFGSVLTAGLYYVLNRKKA